ncbi:MAG TPA: hypothetical protein VK249_08630 [Anaerolineales bacterium]|nr:hypothetical protein [Anaerolineales bacterium]
MTPEAKPKKDNRGGVRVPGPGKKLGAPRQMRDGAAIKLYLDAATLQALDRIYPGNRSKAIRILAGTDKP